PFRRSPNPHGHRNRETHDQGLAGPGADGSLAASGVHDRSGGEFHRGQRPRRLRARLLTPGARHRRSDRSASSPASAKIAGISWRQSSKSEISRRLSKPARAAWAPSKTSASTLRRASSSVWWVLPVAENPRFLILWRG